MTTLKRLLDYFADLTGQSPADEPVLLGGDVMSYDTLFPKNNEFSEIFALIPGPNPYYGQSGETAEHVSLDDILWPEALDSDLVH